MLAGGTLTYSSLLDQIVGCRGLLSVRLHGLRTRILLRLDRCAWVRIFRVTGDVVLSSWWSKYQVAIDVTTVDETNLS